MYIRKEIANFVKKMPKELKLPKHWKKFVNDHSVDYNLILKHGNTYECTNCHKYFPCKKEIGHIEKCPFCNNKYLVRNHNLKNYIKLFDLASIDNFDNKLIIRYFEVRTVYNYKTKSFDKSVSEYARIVPELDIELVNDRFTKYLASESIRHTKRIKKWRVFTGMYGLNQYYDAVYLENINEKLKGTKFEYSQLKEAIDYINKDKINLKELLEKAKYSSFELLIKAKLYNLALNCPEKFNEKGNFEKRFGVSKDFYNFMKKHNITYQQLRVLSIVKRKNIDKINRILRIGGDHIERIQKASKYVDLLKLEEYSKHQKNFTIHSYLDYIRNIEKLEIPLDNKKILFPENFWKAHDESVNKVKVVGNKGLNKRIKKRYEELSKNTYSDKSYLIRPAKTLSDIKNESKQQNNCVYKNYSEKYAFGDTDIYFLRSLDAPQKSLVTIEVSNNKVIQSRTKNNSRTNKEQDSFIKKWENNILKAA